MAQELELFGKPLPMPKHIAEAYAGEESNIIDGDSRPALTIMGKVWTINANNEKQKLMRIVDDEEIPLASLPVVILDYAKQRGRAYYETDFDPDNVSSPTCYSDDGVAPEENSEQKQHPTCNGCPMSIKGSKVSQGGKAVAACSQHRILAVIPIKRLDLPVLRLRLAITSDYDGQSKELMAKGQFAFSNYLSFIKPRGVPHTSAIVTKLSFDTNVAYPKILFAASRWCEDKEVAAIKALRQSGQIEAILGTTGEPIDGTKNVTAKALEKPKPGTTKAPPPEDDEDDGAAAADAAQVAKAKAEHKAAEKALKAKADAKAAKKAEAQKAAAAAAAALAAADEDDEEEGAGVAADPSMDEEDDGDGDIVVASAPAPKTNGKATGKAGTGKPKTPATPEAVPVAEVSDEVAAMLGGWGDD